MLRNFTPFLSKYKYSSILASITIIFEVYFETRIPALMSQIIDTGVTDQNLDLIYDVGGRMIWCACISLLFGVLSGVFAARGGIGFGAQLRKGIFDKIQDYSFSNIDNFSTPSLITRLTTDVTNVQMAYMMIIRVMVRSPVMLVAAAIMARSINTELVEIFIISIPLLGGALFIIMRAAHPRFRRMLDKTDNLNRSVQENLTGIRVVKAFNRQQFEMDQFAESNQALINAMLNAQKLLISIFPVMMVVMNGTILAVIWFGGNMIIRGNFYTGDLISFITYCTQILMSLMMIGQSLMMVTVAFSSLTRINEVLAEPIDISDADAVKSLRVEDGSVAFKDVYFKYDQKGDEYILDDINLEIKSGETIGVIGGTGSSKSSLVQLIPRLYDATRGEVYVSGHNVKDYTLEHLRDEIGMVLQKNTLFSGTIAENLRWGNKDATDEQLMEACRDASIDDFIRDLPDGLNTDLGQGGVNLSGGQKQRLCIARALLKKPKIIILDDSTSAVDMNTDRAIRASFKKNLKGMTTIIIAQRIASVEDSDRIVVMDDGRVAAFDTPERLAETNKIYRDILESQNSELPEIEVAADEIIEIPKQRTIETMPEEEEIEEAEIIEGDGLLKGAV